MLRKVFQPGDGIDLFELIGECYVHGMMAGEALDIKNEARNTDYHNKQDFRIR